MNKIDFNKLPKAVNSAVKEALSDRFGNANEEIEKYLSILSVREIFEIYLRWIGIVGYTEDIIEALDGIRAAKA